MPKTTITFTGLLVFRRDPHTRNYEVGVLRARNAHHPHIFGIIVKPNPDGSPTLELESTLEEHVQNGDILWELAVEPEGRGPAGIEVRPDPPQNRKNPPPGNRDFGWIINLQREFHSTLNRKPGGLQPIILFKTGNLFTRCKTEFVDVLQNGEPRDFGFIAGELALTINTPQGQELVLYVLKKNGDRVPIFQLLNTHQIDYEISIRNIPRVGSSPAPTGGHFHMFYDLLFDNVPHEERIAIEAHDPLTHPPFDRCSGGGADEPDPFKCGGVTVEGDPLGHP